MSEKYAPSEEEIARAEESMTDSQRVASSERGNTLEGGRTIIGSVPRPEVYYDKNSEIVTFDGYGEAKRYKKAEAIAALDDAIKAEKSMSERFCSRLEGFKSALQQDLDKS